MSVFIYSGGPCLPAEGPLTGLPESQRWYFNFEFIRRRRMDPSRGMQATLTGDGSDGIRNWFDVPAVGVLLP